MTSLTTTILHSVEQFLEHRDAWNDLWSRSNVTAPSAQAEMIAHWVEHFESPANFLAITVSDGSRLVAALPLVRRRMKGLISTVVLPQNEWTSGGDLLVDPHDDLDGMLDPMVQALRDRLRSVLWLDTIAFENSHWQAFATALERAGYATDIHRQDQIATVEIFNTYQAYEQSRKADHRRSRRRYTRKLDEAGDVEFCLHHPSDPDEVDRLIQTTFECENQSWKGAQGTSVIKTDGMLPYFQEQARLLAAKEQLEIGFLRHNGEVIAAFYGWRSKGTRFIPKLGYNEQFRKFGPGQQLVMKWLEHLHDTDDCQLLDFWGPLSAWNKSWATQTYPIGRLFAAPKTLLGRGLFHVYDIWRPRWKHLQQRFSAPRDETAA